MGHFSLSLSLFHSLQVYIIEHHIAACRNEMSRCICNLPLLSAVAHPAIPCASLSWPLGRLLFWYGPGWPIANIVLCIGRSSGIHATARVDQAMRVVTVVSGLCKNAHSAAEMPMQAFAKSPWVLVCWKRTTGSADGSRGGA